MDGPSMPRSHPDLSGLLRSELVSRGLSTVTELDSLELMAELVYEQGVDPALCERVVMTGPLPVAEYVRLVEECAHALRPLDPVRAGVPSLTDPNELTELDALESQLFAEEVTAPPHPVSRATTDDEDELARLEAALEDDVATGQGMAPEQPEDWSESERGSGDGSERGSEDETTDDDREDRDDQHSDHYSNRGDGSPSDDPLTGSNARQAWSEDTQASAHRATPPVQPATTSPLTASSPSEQKYPEPVSSSDDEGDMADTPPPRRTPPVPPISLPPATGAPPAATDTTGAPPAATDAPPAATDAPPAATGAPPAAPPATNGPLAYRPAAAPTSPRPALRHTAADDDDFTEHFREVPIEGKGLAEMLSQVAAWQDRQSTSAPRPTDPPTPAPAPAPPAWGPRPLTHRPPPRFGAASRARPQGTHPVDSRPGTARSQSVHAMRGSVARRPAGTVDYSSIDEDSDDDAVSDSAASDSDRDPRRPVARERAGPARHPAARFGGRHSDDSFDDSSDSDSESESESTDDTEDAENDRRGNGVESGDGSDDESDFLPGLSAEVLCQRTLEEPALLACFTEHLHGLVERDHAGAVSINAIQPILDYLLDRGFDPPRLRTAVLRIRRTEFSRLHTLRYNHFGALVQLLLRRYRDD